MQEDSVTFSSPTVSERKQSSPPQSRLAPIPLSGVHEPSQFMGASNDVSVPPDQHAAV
jgi:hypothetical protein